MAYLVGTIVALQVFVVNFSILMQDIVRVDEIRWRISGMLILAFTLCPLAGRRFLLDAARRRDRALTLGGAHV